MIGNLGGGLIKQLLGEEVEDDRPEFPIAAPPAEHGDDRYLQLRMKKKYQLGLIRKMLEESGYGDLAKMSTLSRREPEDIGD